MWKTNATSHPSFDERSYWIVPFRKTKKWQSFERSIPTTMINQMLHRSRIIEKYTRHPGSKKVRSQMIFKIWKLIIYLFFKRTCVTIGMPSKNMKKHIANANSFLRGRSTEDHLSTKPVINDSTLQNSLSIPIICKISRNMVMQIGNNKYDTGKY